MKKAKIFMIAAFVLAIGSAFALQNHSATKADFANKDVFYDDLTTPSTLECTPITCGDAGPQLCRANSVIYNASPCVNLENVFKFVKQ